MKTIRSFFPLLALAAGLFTASAAVAHEGHKDEAGQHAEKGVLVPVKDKNSEWYKKAKAEYPSDSCVVSEDKLEGGEMGLSQEFIYREEGKPDRLVRLCCKDCVKDFNKNPSKYMKMLDEAAAKKAKASS